VRRAREAGFTLLETLVALAILGVVLATVFDIFGQGLRAAHRNEDRLLLALVAQNLMARSRLDYRPGDGELRGDIDGGLRWTITSEPYEPPANLLPEVRGPRSTNGLDRRDGTFDSEGGGFGERRDGGFSDGSGLGSRDGYGDRSAGGFGDRSDGGSFGDRSRDGSFADRSSSEGGFGDRSGESGFGERRDEDGLGSRESGDSGTLGDAEGRGDGRPGTQPRERLRLRLVRVVVEKGQERFELTSLAMEPRRARAR
jgi:type II secretion system protein I